MDGLLTRNEPLDKWLGTAKRITEACLNRTSAYDGLCFSGNSSDDLVAEIARHTKRIAALVEELIAIETDGIGTTALLGRAPTTVEAVAVALLVASRLDRDAAREIRDISSVVSLTAARDPVVALQCRGLFRSDGSLYGHCNIEYRNTLDESRVTLKEHSLNTILSQPSDRTEMLCDSYMVVGGRR